MSDETFILTALHGDMREEPLEPADVAELQQSVGWLEGVSRRMQSTIDGLLLLTEVDRQALDPVPVDMGYALGRARGAMPMAGGNDERSALATSISSPPTGSGPDPRRCRSRGPCFAARGRGAGPCWPRGRP